jgi:hypothetical protein
MSFLNFIVAITKSEGSAFQIGIIRVEKKYFLTSFLAIGVASFKGCPRVVDKLGKVKKSSNLRAFRPWTISKHMTKSKMRRLCSRL